ncbi:MAG: von Willebrand factor type A domain-containing protein, partial [Acidobacteria bacterium]|nr:von Willebrand factor type A domain-containing protein [Acidobacteriota bacterium]
MSGGWRFWQRWLPWQRWTTARRLARYARRETGAPPPDLLRRLRDDIPALPAMAYEPVAARRDDRRGARGRLMVAASLAAALTAGVVGLRVWQGRSRPVDEAAPEAAAVGAPTAAATVQREALGAKPRPIAREEPAEAQPPFSPPLSASPQPAPAAAAPAPPAPSPAGAAAPSLSMAAPAGSSGAAAPGAAASRSRQPAGSGRGLGYAGRGAGTAGGGAGVVSGGRFARKPVTAGAAVEGSPAPSAAAGAAAAAPGRAEYLEVTAESPVAVPAAPVPEKRELAAAPRAAAKAQASPSPAPPAEPSGVAAPLRSSFGADTGTASYRRVRHGLLDEGRLPQPASVRADELANAFDLAAEVPPVGRPEVSVEGAPLPGTGATYLLRFEARGLAGPSNADAVEVDFDPRVVARFRRVGATAHLGGASALYEVELRDAAGRAPSAVAAAGVSPAGRPAPPPRAAASTQSEAAAPRAAGERSAPAAAAPAGYPATDPVIASV